MSDWDVGKALKDVSYAMSDGAGLHIDPGDLLELSGLLENDFETEKARGRDWNNDKRVVLPLANLVGIIATLATYADWEGGDPPAEVDSEHLFGAMALVSKAVCPYVTRRAKAAITLGGYCQYFAKGGDPTKIAGLKHSVRKLLDILELPPAAPGTTTPPDDSDSEPPEGRQPPNERG